MLVLWLSLALGPVSLPLGDTLRAALRLAGLPLDGTGLAQAEMILGQIRLPRTLLGLAVGAVLALSGVAMQGLFRNPLADPGLVGVSSGAASARRWPSYSAPRWAACRRSSRLTCCRCAPSAAAWG